MDQDSSDFGYLAPPSVAGRDDFYSEAVAPLYDVVDDDTRGDCKAMAIENTWAEDVEGFSVPPSADFPIPLGPPGGFESVACLDGEAPPPGGEAGSFADSGLGMLFSAGGDADADMHDDVKDAGAEPGVCGLRNMGNTCFMGAGLQCVAATPPVVEFFLNRSVRDKDEESRCLTDQFSLLIHKMWSGRYAVLRPHHFKHALAINHPQFKDYRQHDCQEFLALLLDNLHEQLNTAGGKGDDTNNVSGGDCPGSNQSTSSSSSSSCESSVGEAQQQQPPPPTPTPEAEAVPPPAVAAAEKKNVNTRLNNASVGLRGLQDILKDAKTSNVNVAVAEAEGLRFDSDKFPKYEAPRNLTEFHNFDDKVVSVKRIKETNVRQQQQEAVSNPGLGLNPPDPDECFNNIKRMRLEDAGADERWERHVALNQSVVAQSFQGQFKSTVVCSSCKHVSVTYEPFMYLSVPLPHAMERQICVTFVWSSRREPARYLVTLNKQDKVKTLKAELSRRAGVGGGSVALAEVLDCHISRLLEDALPLRHVNDASRNVYAFELSMSLAGGGGGGDGPGGSVDAPSCAICLEHKDSGVRRHQGCSCVLCDSCLRSYRRHTGREALALALDCPVCGQAADFTELDEEAPPCVVVRPLDVPLVLRLDTQGDGSNNSKKSRLLGHPRLLRLPSRVSGRDLHAVVAGVAPRAKSPYTVLLVDGQGYRCSRCIYTEHCRGCHVGAGDDDLVQLQAGDTLAVRYTEEPHGVAHHEEVLTNSSNSPSSNTCLSLYDCLQAFSQSEQLDEHNPWFCPVCEENRCATKTLTVRRYPDHLIVYLKRFVFHDSVGVKLEDRVAFPLRGLTLPRQPPYDLYACVCHFGGASAGHYTAYTRNPRSDRWHYFNDELVTPQKPHEDDYANAYILFYRKRALY